ncbi:MAG: alpha/beta fold hydrolase, partial [Verrucomicrobia bacterium]|nr:alpha/beta fold hydrolase [Verrucomicrobiota bacterium]
ILLHGFPDDARAWDGVVGHLVVDGFRTIVPYLRGFGPSRFRDTDTVRSGQQAALMQDLNGLIDVLDLQQPILVGYDWGRLPRRRSPILQKNFTKSLASLFARIQYSISRD